MANRRAILRVPLSFWEDLNWLTQGPSTSRTRSELLSRLRIPSQFEPKEHHWDFDSGEFWLRVESDLLPEVVYGELLPTIDFKYEDDKPIGFILTRRETIKYDPELYPLPTETDNGSQQS